MEERHFVCSACGGVSDIPGVCTTEGCEKHGQPLEPCACDNIASHKKEEGGAEEMPSPEGGG